MTIAHWMPVLQARLAEIPRGRITTYRELARALGVKSNRLVGQILTRNPEPECFPCFKVVKSDGGLGGYAPGPEAKIKKLEAEGVRVKDGKIVDFEKKCFTFTRS